MCERAFVFFGVFSCMSVSFHICIRHFLSIQVSFHICRSLFVRVGLVREYAILCVRESVRVSWSLFLYVDFFSYMNRSLFIYIWVCFHLCKSRDRVCESVCARERVCFLVSFHVCRFYFIYV